LKPSDYAFPSQPPRRSSLPATSSALLSELLSLQRMILRVMITSQTLLLEQTISTTRCLFELAAMSAAGVLPFRRDTAARAQPPTPQGLIE
jgi:hypothetical protein